MLIVKRHPIGEKEVIEVAPNRAVIEYLTDYDDRQDLELDVYLNGGELLEEKDYKRILKENDILILSYRVGATVAVAVVVAIVAAVVLVSLAPKPEAPNVVGETKSSPNNSVSGQSNTVRKYEAIPNIYGRVWSYPDLIANAIPQYVADKKQVRELFLIGEGNYQINEIRDSKTNINDVTTSTAQVYGPGTYPADLQRINFNESIDNIDIIAADDPSVSYTGISRFLGNINAAFTASVQGNTFLFESPTGLLPGDTFTTTTGTNIGTYTVVSLFSDYGVTVNQTLIDVGSFESISLTSTRNKLILYSPAVESDMSISAGSEIFITSSASNNGRYTISSISSLSNRTEVSFSGYQIVTEGLHPNFVDVVFTTLNPAGNGNYVGWFDMPTTSEQIWCNFSCPRGLQDQNGNRANINLQIEYQPTDLSTGIQYAYLNFTGLTLTALGKTLKITGLNGSKTYRIRVKRTNSKYPGNAVDSCVFDECFTVNSYAGASFGSVTVLDVLTKASSNERSSSRKINVDVTRILDGVPTTNFADAVKDLIVNKGRRPVSEVDTDGLYAISDSLTDDLKEFSFTFDDKNISLAQAVQTACNVARVNVYRDGQTWRFNRDEAKLRTYVFNRRNLASGDNQRFTQSVRLPNDYDSVALRYYNRGLESFDDVLIRIDTNTQAFIVGEDGARPYQIELAGSSNYAQALNRANLEARKIVYLRRSVEDVALIDAANVDIGDRVSWCDIYDGETMDGEITGREGNIFYTSENIELNDGVTYYAMITDGNGQAMTPVEVSAVEGNKKAFEATLAGEVIIADGVEIQAGSKYIIGDVNDIDDTDYTVVGRGSNENGRISIELVQYNEIIYEAD